MNDDIRSTLATAVGEPPPLGFTSAGVIRTARRHRVRRRIGGAAAAVTALVAVTGSVLAGVAASRPAEHRAIGSLTTGPAAHPPGALTQRELAARMDRAVRAAAPARLGLIRREVRWLERVVDPGNASAALWRAQYFINRENGSHFNVATNEPPPTGQQASCAVERTDDTDCRETTARDGTRLVIVTVHTELWVIHGVQNVRADGTETAAYVMYPPGQHAPATDAELIRVATDPALHYVRPGDAGPPPSRR